MMTKKDKGKFLLYKYFLRCLYLKLCLELEKDIVIPMKKSFLNFIYWILVKSAESYYGESIKTEVPYTPYFQIYTNFIFNKGNYGLNSINFGIMIYELKLWLQEFSIFYLNIIKLLKNKELTHNEFGYR